MSLQQMDMNVVMYPEIIGPADNGKSKKMENEEPIGQNMGEMDGMKGMKMNEDMYKSNELSEITTLNYAMLKSPTQTTLPEEAQVRELHFTLTGNMNRYVWSLDNKVISESDKILIKKGEKVRITLYNNSMMRHPMHLHGHDFRLLNGQGEYAPLKNVVDIMPMETDVIEFEAKIAGSTSV